MLFNDKVGWPVEHGIIVRNIYLKNSGQRKGQLFECFTGQHSDLINTRGNLEIRSAWNEGGSINDHHLCASREHFGPSRWYLLVREHSSQSMTSFFRAAARFWSIAARVRGKIPSQSRFLTLLEGESRRCTAALNRQSTNFTLNNFYFYLVSSSLYFRLSKAFVKFATD